MIICLPAIYLDSLSRSARRVNLVGYRLPRQVFAEIPYLVHTLQKLSSLPRTVYPCDSTYMERLQFLMNRLPQ